MESIKKDEVQIYKLVNRRWKALPSSGDDISIKDPKLKQGYLGDLDAKTLIELEEIFQRNAKLLNNKFLLSRLKDKGKRLQAQQNELAAALEKTRGREKCAKEVPHQNDVHGFEWTGTLTNNKEYFNEGSNPLDLEDEDLDPLKLMSNHSAVVEPLERRIARMNEDEEDPASVIARELEQLDINDSAHAAEAATFGAKREQMFQEKYRQNGPAKTSFKPFRPVNNPRPIPGIFVKQKPLELKPVIGITQKESQKLETEFLDKEKKRDVKHMMEGLGHLKKGQHIGGVPPAFGKYRDTNVMKHILDSDEEDVDEDETYEFHNHGIYDDDGDEEDS